MKPQNILFLGEFSERFCFWGLQSILVLYLVKVAHLSTIQSYKVQGVFTAGSFLFCILGGFFSDRILGFKWSLKLGSILIVIGSVVLGCSGVSLLNVGLLIISLGNGFFEPSCASLLGDPRNFITENQEKDFTLLYMSMNLGAVLGPLFYGLLSVEYGWKDSILLNAMVMGVWCFVFFGFKDKLFDVSDKKSEKKTPYIKFSIGPILGILGLMIFCTLYFSTTFQVDNSLIMFSKMYVNASIFGYQISVTTFAGFEPFFVILFAPVGAHFSSKVDSSFRNTFIRLSAGFLLAALGFMVYEFSASQVGVYEAKISILWMLLGSLFLGFGEVCFMPSVISAVTKHAPTKIRGTVTGLFYCSFALSGYFSGFAAKMTSTTSTNTNINALIFYEVYKHTALFLFSISGFLFLLIFIFSSMRRPAFLDQ